MEAEATCPTCALLRAATLHVAGNRGLSEVSLERICECSGLSVDEVHDHYPSRSGCLCATYDELADELVDDFADAFARSLTWDDGLLLGLSRMLAKLAGRPAAARFCFLEVLQGDRELLRHRERARRRLLELFVAEHRRRSEFEELHQMQLELLLGAVFQLVASRVAEGFTDELPGLGDELIQLTGMFEPAAA